MVYRATVVFHGFYPFSPLDRNQFNLLILPVINILELIGTTDNSAEFGRGAQAPGASMDQQPLAR